MRRPRPGGSLSARESCNSSEIDEVEEGEEDRMSTAKNSWLS